MSDSTTNEEKVTVNVVQQTTTTNLLSTEEKMRKMPFQNIGKYEITKIISKCQYGIIAEAVLKSDKNSKLSANRISVNESTQCKNQLSLMQNLCKNRRGSNNAVIKDRSQFYNYKCKSGGNMRNILNIAQSNNINVDVSNNVKPANLYQSPIALNNKPINPSKKYILKILERKLFQKDSFMFKRLERECRIHHFLDCNSIVKKYETIYTDDYIVFVLENCENGDLINFIKRCGVLYIHQKIKIIKDIIEAIAYLHSRNIVHRDIKLDNIFIDENGDAKLGDFGCSEITLENQEGMYEPCGTIYYIPPEIMKVPKKENNDQKNIEDNDSNDNNTNEKIEYNYHYDPMKGDIWSFGIVVYVIMLGRFPWKTIPNGKNQAEDSDLEVMPEILALDELEIPASVPSEVAELIHCCCQVDPNNRPTAEMVKNFPILNMFSNNKKCGTFNTMISYDINNQKINGNGNGPSSEMQKKQISKQSACSPYSSLARNWLFRPNVMMMGTNKVNKNLALSQKMYDPFGYMLD